MKMLSFTGKELATQVFSYFDFSTRVTHEVYTIFELVTASHTDFYKLFHSLTV